jgi:protein TonB
VLLPLANKQTAFAGALGNLSISLVSNLTEDARTSHPCERGAGFLRQLSNPQEAGVAKIPVPPRRTFLWRCVMSIEPGPSPQNDFGSLQGCFVEGSAEQRARERRIRRRALIISIAAQSAILIVIVLIPLFGKPERIALAMTPIPPYYSSRGPEHPNTAPIEPRHGAERNLCATCYSPVIPNRLATTDNTPPQDPIPGVGAPNGRTGVQPPWGIGIDDSRRQPARPADANPQTPRLLHVTHLERAMLVQRVEPVYPPLARQIHREGQVELHAVIATDGTIQSLQVVSGDPLFLQSALDAVRQWRYHPTILNGQAVEIDTYITVIYSLQH